MTETTSLTQSQRPLPADPEGINDARAVWAGAALSLFCQLTGADREDALGDLLADMMYWADRKGFDFDLALERAGDHYQAETLSADARTGSSELATPWTLHFERDGTEDIAVIRDSDGEDLATSRPFWLPQGDDPIPPTQASLRLMPAAPHLLEALDRLLEQTVDQDRKFGIDLSEGEPQARTLAWAAIAEATSRT